MEKSEIERLIDIVLSSVSIEWLGDTFKLVEGVDGDARALFEIFERMHNQ